MSNYSNVTSILDKSYNLIAKQIPNPTELIVMSAMKSQIESYFNAQIHAYLGDAQFSRIVLADLIKTGKTIAVITMGAERGNTGLNYTYTHLASDFVKIICRSAVVGSYYKLKGISAIPHAAAVSNYVCEIPARFIVNSDDAAQVGGYTDKGILYSVEHHFSLYNFFRATSNALLKVSGLYFASKGVDYINPYLKKTVIGPIPVLFVMSIATEEVRTFIMVTVSRLSMTTADFSLETIHDAGKKAYDSFNLETAPFFDLDEINKEIVGFLKTQSNTGDSEL